jgi:hypothetical protein
MRRLPAFGLEEGNSYRDPHKLGHFSYGVAIVLLGRKSQFKDARNSITKCAWIVRVVTIENPRLLEEKVDGIFLQGPILIRQR